MRNRTREQDAERKRAKRAMMAEVVSDHAEVLYLRAEVTRLLSIIERMIGLSHAGTSGDVSASPERPRIVPTASPPGLDAGHDAPLRPPARAPAPARKISSSQDILSLEPQNSNPPNPAEPDASPSVPISVPSVPTNVPTSRPLGTSVLRLRDGRIVPGGGSHVPEEKKLTPDEEPSHARPVTPSGRRANGVGVLKLGGERSGE